MTNSLLFTSQYRSHGYLFNQEKRKRIESERVCLNTVLTVISLIVNVNSASAQSVSLNTVLTVISLIHGR